MGTLKRGTLKTILFLSLTIILIGCNDARQNTRDTSWEIQRFEIDTLTAFTDFETHNIAQPSIVQVLQNGEVAVGDFAQKSITILDKAGNILTTFGAEGRGPGEFIMPTAIKDTPGTLNVVDRGQFKVSQFSDSGEFLNSYSYKSAGNGATAEVIDDSVFAVGTGGRGGKLVEVVDLKKDSTLAFGETMGEAVDGIQVQKSLSQLQKGEMPAFFKNMVTLHYKEPFLYVFLNSYSILQKYTLDGDLVWEKDIKLPYNQRLIDQTIERSKQMQGRGIPTFAFITGFRVYDDGIYMFTPGIEDDPQLLVKLDLSANIHSIHSLPGGPMSYLEFSINEQSRDLYLGSFQDGKVYRTKLPQAR
ncbi:hypothetical protein [Gracilimonas mengyeensis]|uniref:6-bladed beta-propeller protein n=1 Tax=Gracilimonas mengyeensis TaxID=1302730 RepID=A0A521EK49_9BACT|nr:hypothetical protein [Gracilimonas mengyeensis]SMO84286.1 hypothetical protein SAMN06265219_11298 [Gracilimonas mengyeensis]